MQGLVRVPLILCRGEGMDFFLKPVSKPIAFDLQIIMCLKIKPKLRRGSEIAPQTQGCVGRYRSCAVYDFVDAPRGNSNIVRQPVLTDPHGIQKLFLENFPGMNSWKVLFHGCHLNGNPQFQHRMHDPHSTGNICDTAG